ncbi:hypothetical protein PtrSN002B_010735 [Pyrenophora tritici-repentis]|uniref:Uncharacterized protein n=2 Tax=Pyrenophora tritici-repentis TaxID=45151 RepID=A0A2W1EBP3_9PLEO|nr:uncharacterized protein PTRG_09133 [Pyrenophora tritici-repentis Pt-1C-BFP]KAA8627727.1 hypothetical protein PtrV1_03407 [Pyrenophora tritici-repentis]EDU42184.1 conserved hypothetical protein [Pyrenophora tritici-repentis Pt-1C-BFP]KAF7442242.1 hypothetical protein A1F99_131110 [Pyrenophora tritici-repentis]KAF7579386.1 hypothetical protein PtrM4_036260 [Pyrenophora tritici-repentis]KAG9378305.1 hypothetical protein A1F94_011421 [Pyrenophora tritici-repentis]
MPPHLHPRSRMTTSLFTTTLMVSFLVVAAPHLIPCPVDPRTLADSADPTGERRRRRRKLPEDETCNDIMREERRRRMLLEEKLAARRECPVPKPGGLIGQVLGVQKEGDEEEPRLSIMQRVEKTICQPWGKDDNQ